MLEALAHAQAAGCPIVLALTKCDMPNANVSRVKNQLLSEGLLLEEAGGNVLVRGVRRLHTSQKCLQQHRCHDLGRFTVVCIALSLSWSHQHALHP